MPIQASTLNHRLSSPNKLFESLATGLPVVVSDFLEMRRIVLEDPDGPASIPLEREDPHGTMVGERHIAPPLRRWASARVLRTDPRTLDKLRARAAELGPIDGGAIASGVLDAVEVLDARGARRTIELGLDWPRGSVRLLALDVLAAIDPEDAARRAATDPDRKVRAWSPARLRPRAEPGPDGGKAGRHDPLGAQAELFPEGSDARSIEPGPAGARSSADDLWPNRDE